jgi:hypothetical protein
MLITTLIYGLLIYNSSSAASAKTVWIHHIHVAGGASCSATMVAVCVPVFVCCGCCPTDSSFLYVKKWYKITFSMRLATLLCVPHWRAPHPKPLQRQAVMWCHNYLQHPGHTRLEEYWKGMCNTIRSTSKSCKTCNLSIPIS